MQLCVAARSRVEGTLAAAAHTGHRLVLTAQQQSARSIMCGFSYIGPVLFDKGQSTSVIALGSCCLL